MIIRTIRLATIAISVLLPAALLPAATKSVRVALHDGSGKSVGSARISPHDGGVWIKLDLKGLAPGGHALHFHQNAKCDGPDFKSAGPHFNPDGKHHGLENPEGPHAGDMPNFTVGANGTAKTAVMNPRVNLGTDSHSLFTNGGTALVIHAKDDDLKSDPAGNAGDRIACGVVVP